MLSCFGDFILDVVNVETFRSLFKNNLLGCTCVSLIGVGVLPLSLKLCGDWKNLTFSCFLWDTLTKVDAIIIIGQMVSCCILRGLLMFS